MGQHMNGRETVNGRAIRILISIGFAMFLAVGLFSRFPQIVNNNDWINSLGWGIPIDPNADANARFVDAARANCATVLPPSSRQSECIAYQNNLGHLYLGHPVVGVIGSLLPKFDLRDKDLMLTAQYFLFGAISANLIVVVAIVSAALWFLKGRMRIAVPLIVSALLLPIHPKFDVGLASFAGTPNARDTVLFLAALFAAVCVAAGGRYARKRYAPKVPGPAGTRERNAVLLAAILAAVALLQLLAVAGLGSYGVVALALALLLFAAADSESSGLAPFEIAVCLLVFAVAALQAPSLVIYMRIQVAIAATLLFAAMVQNPANRRLAIILPATLLLHPAAAMLVALSIFFVEICVLAIRRRATTLLASSLLTAAGGACALYFLKPQEIITVTNLSAVDAFRPYFASLAFAPSFLLAALCLLAAIWQLRKEGKPALQTGRALLFVCQILITSNFASAAAAFDDPATKWQANVFSIGYFHYYYAPAAAMFAVVAAAFAILDRRAGHAVDSGEPVPAPGAFWIPAMLIAAILAFSGPTNLARHAYYAATVVYRNGILGEPVASIVPYLGILNVTDNSYFFSRSNPENHALMYASLLKMKIKIANGTISQIDPKSIP